MTQMTMTTRKMAKWTIALLALTCTIAMEEESAHIPERLRLPCYGQICDVRFAYCDKVAHKCNFDCNIVCEDQKHVCTKTCPGYAVYTFYVGDRINDSQTSTISAPTTSAPTTERLPQSNITYTAKVPNMTTAPTISYTHEEYLIRINDSQTSTTIAPTGSAPTTERLPQSNITHTAKPKVPNTTSAPTISYTHEEYLISLLEASLSLIIITCILVAALTIEKFLPYTKLFCMKVYRVYQRVPPADPEQEPQPMAILGDRPTQQTSAPQVEDVPDPQFSFFRNDRRESGIGDSASGNTQSCTNETRLNVSQV